MPGRATLSPDRSLRARRALAGARTVIDGIPVDVPAAGGGSDIVPVIEVPITVPFDEALLALTTGSSGPDGAASYLNDTRADVSAALAVAEFDLDAGAYEYQAAGAYELHDEPDANFGLLGVILLAELRRRSDNARIGWASNNDPFMTAFNYHPPDMLQGDFDGNMHDAGAGADASQSPGGRLLIVDDVHVTLRVINQGGNVIDPYTGDVVGRDVDVVELGVAVSPL